MPFHPIHLAQTATARGWAKSVGTSAKDAQVINGLFEVATNPLLGTKTIYVTKRAGSTTGISIGSSLYVMKHYSNKFSKIHHSQTTMYEVGTAIGTSSIPISQMNNTLPDAIVSGVGILCWVDTSSFGYFVYSNAISTNFPTFQGTTHTNTVIDGITSTTGLYPGQLITGAGIQAGTRIATITSAVAITTTIATTASATITITKEAVARIIDPDFPTNAVSIDFLDAYFQAGAETGNIHQSATNDPSSWSASDVIAADYCGDDIRVTFRWQNYIVAAGRKGTIQYFYNAGNPTGSVLSSAGNLTMVGLCLAQRPMVNDGVAYVIASPTDITAGTARSYGLFRLSGANTFTKVSDDIWDGIIETVCDNTPRVEYAVVNDKALIVLTQFSGSSPAIVYDPKVNMFSLFTMPAALSSSFEGEFTVAGQSTIFAWASGNTWTDSSAAFTLTIQTEPQDMNNGMDATDTWVDLLSDNESSGTTTLSVTDDDYANWTTVGTFDMTATKKRINSLGQHNLRAYRLQHSANTGWRGQILRVKYEPATI